MPRTANTSSLPPAEERLVNVPLRALHTHPLNANLMSEERLDKLARNISREGRYPPLVVRPHPEMPGEYQVLDGHQRREVLRRLGHDAAVCFVWDCDDETALLLLATLNRLEGEDVPAKRAELLTELTSMLSVEELALLLPEDASQINDTLALFALDGDALLAELTDAVEREGAGVRVVSFALTPEDEEVVEMAIGQVVEHLEGPNRRGRALAEICRRHLEGRSDD
jgi:ParB-like chromosome segregation protein Spo0J